MIINTPFKPSCLKENKRLFLQKGWNKLDSCSSLSRINLSPCLTMEANPIRKKQN